MKEKLNSLIEVPGRGEILGKRGRIDADGVMDVDGRRGNTIAAMSA